jgi:tryptophanyl-tRNA synthetase
MRARRKELETQPEYVEEVLKRGADQARRVARPLVQKARAAVGIPNE